MCSCFAGVYNERLLKGEGQNVHLMVQNTFMYLDSIVSNCLFLFIQGQLSDVCSTFFPPKRTRERLIRESWEILLLMLTTHIFGLVVCMVSCKNTHVSIYYTYSNLKEQAKIYTLGILLSTTYYIH